MIANSRRDSRPDFDSPEDWLSHFYECRAEGCQSWHPATRDELLLAERRGLMELHPEWMPCKVGLRLLGLPDWFGRELKPLSLFFQERFVQTLLGCPDSVASIRRILSGSAT